MESTFYHEGMHIMENTFYHSFRRYMNLKGLDKRHKASYYAAFVHYLSKHVLQQFTNLPGLTGIQCDQHDAYLQKAFAWVAVKEENASTIKLCIQKTKDTVETITIFLPGHPLAN